MKKIIILFLVLITLLSGCGEYVEYKFMYDVSMVESIDYVSVEWNKINEIYDFTVISSMESELFHSFFNDFKDVECYDYNIDKADFNNDNGIKVTYINGEYEVINTTGRIEFKGNEYKSIDRFVFGEHDINAILIKYFMD